MQSAAKRDTMDSCELPEDINLPLETMDDLQRLERKLRDSMEMRALLVGT